MSGGNMEREDQILCVTTDTAPGWDIAEALGIVGCSASSVETAMSEMRETAANQGANAIVGVRLSAVSFPNPVDSEAAQVTEYIAYGTAVVLE